LVSTLLDFFFLMSFPIFFTGPPRSSFFPDASGRTLFLASFCCNVFSLVAPLPCSPCQCIFWGSFPFGVSSFKARFRIFMQGLVLSPGCRFYSTASRVRSCPPPLFVPFLAFFFFDVGCFVTSDQVLSPLDSFLPDLCFHFSLFSFLLSMRFFSSFDPLPFLPYSGFTLEHSPVFISFFPV